MTDRPQCPECQLPMTYVGEAFHVSGGDDEKEASAIWMCDRDGRLWRVFVNGVIVRYRRR